MADLGQLTDEQVAAAVRGAEDALPWVLEAIAPRVRAMVTARLNPTSTDFHATDELVQLSMVALSSGIPRLKNKTVVGLRSFASGIVVRKVADYLGRRGEGDLTGPRHASLDSTSAYARAWQYLSASGTLPGRTIEQNDQLALVLTEISRLRQDDRELIAMAFFDQIPTNEIADHLGLSRRAASMRLMRAVRRLRHRLLNSDQAKEHEDG